MSSVLAPYFLFTLLFLGKLQFIIPVFLDRLIVAIFLRKINLSVNFRSLFSKKEQTFFWLLPNGGNKHVPRYGRVIAESGFSL